MNTDYHNSVKPANVSPPNDFNTIQEDAKNNTINTAATPQAPVQFQSTLISVQNINIAAEEKPQSLLSKMVQWFNRVILGRGAAQDAAADATGAQESLPEIPLEQPKAISDEMVDSLAQDFEKLFAKSKNTDSEIDELFQSNNGSIDHLYNVLVKRMLNHYKNNSDERKVNAEIILTKHEDIASLQNKRKDLNENLTAVQYNQKFWDRINTGSSAALALFTIGNMALLALGGAPVALVALVGTLQAGAAISSGATQIVSAGIKKSSNSLTGEFISNKEDIQLANEKLDIDMKLLSDSHRSLVKVIKNLKQLNEKQNQVLMTFTDMRRS